MSTRACYTFKDEHNAYHVYKHFDGYPSGAEQWIRAALDHAWKLPRFEADDFGAAFIAANKGENGGGNCRLMHSGDIKQMASADIEYRYEIEAHNGVLHVTVYSTDYWDSPIEEKLWSGPLSTMKSWADQYEKETA